MTLPPLEEVTVSIVSKVADTTDRYGLRFARNHSFSLSAIPRHEETEIRAAVTT